MRRAWSKATALAPTVLLPAALAGASGALLAEQPGNDRTGTLHAHEDSRGLGASGRLPREGLPSRGLLQDADDPRELTTGAGPEVEVPSGELGISDPMLDAYVSAADRLARTQPDCGVHWSVLASLGRIESEHARGGEVDVRGTTVSAILGPRLSGQPGMAAVPDTDGGELDGDPVWDRAVGSMQFIPETWRKYAADGNEDGVASPHNIHDATLSAGRFLCAGGTDLRNPQELAAAVFRYNHSESYVRTVLMWSAAYALGVVPTPSQPVPEVDEAEVLANSLLPNRPEIVALPPAIPLQPGIRPGEAPPSHSLPAAPDSPDPQPELPEFSEPAEPSTGITEQHEAGGSEVAEAEQEESLSGESASAESGTVESEAVEETAATEAAEETAEETEVLSESVAESLSELAQSQGAQSQGAQSSGDAEASTESSAPSSTGSPDPSEASEEPPAGDPPAGADSTGHEPSSGEEPESTPSTSTPPAGEPSEGESSGTKPLEGESSGTKPLEGESSGTKPPESEPPTGEQMTERPPSSTPPASTPPAGEPSPSTSQPAGRPPGTSAGEPEPCDPAALERGAFVTEPVGVEPEPGTTPAGDALPGGVVFMAPVDAPEIMPCRVPDGFDPGAESAPSAPLTTAPRTSQHP